MLDVLVGSRPPHVVKPAWFSGSVVLHALFLGIVFSATQAAVEAPRVLVADTTLLFLPRLAPPPALPPGTPRPRAALPAGSGDAGALVLTAEPPPKGFQTVVAPTDIPTTIPPVNFDERPFDPRNYTGRGVEGGVAYGVVGGTGVVDPDAVPVGVEDVVYAAATEDARFEAAALISQPDPKYPAVLEEAGISGAVVLRFVVDTSGRVEWASIRVIESTREEFVAPARESVAGAVFRPARLGVRTVRQLAEEPIRFVAMQ
jgi:TonB family protein